MRIQARVAPLTILLVVLLSLLATSCGELTLDNPNGRGPDPILRARFQNGNAFPHAASADDVLLIESSDTDTGDPTVVRVYIDGDKVRTLTNAGLQFSIPFPPETWTPSAGEHAVHVESNTSDTVRELTFTWQ
jgi:hypothetical protein